MSAFHAQVLVYNYYILVIFLLSSNFIACSICGRLRTLGRLASNSQFVYIKARIRISSLYTRESLVCLYRTLKDDISEPIPMSKYYKAQNKPPIEVEVRKQRVTQLDQTNGTGNWRIPPTPPPTRVNKSNTAPRLPKVYSAQTRFQVSASFTRSFSETLLAPLRLSDCNSPQKFLRSHPPR